MKLLLFTVIAVLAAVNASTITVEIDGSSYQAHPFVSNDPTDLYNYGAYKANTNSFLNRGIERKRAAVLAFLRTDDGMYLNIIMDKPDGSGNFVNFDGRAKFTARCKLNGQTDVSVCRDIFKNAVLCDDSSECGVNTNANNVTVGPWRWVQEKTDGMVTGKFPDGCNEITIKFARYGDPGITNEKFRHIRRVVFVGRKRNDPLQPIKIKSVRTREEVVIKFCASPAPVNCDRGVAHSYGDPHFQTADGIRYDYYKLGEHVFCQSKNNDISIQACHQGRGSDLVTMNRAVIARVGDEEIFFGKGNDGNFAIIVDTSDGVQDVTNLGDDTIILDSGRIFGTFCGSTSYITVQHENGWELTMRGRTEETLFVDILSFTGPVTEFPGAEGLCGQWDCDDTNDFTLRNGTVFTSPTQSQINAFGESWSILDAESYFVDFPDARVTDSCYRFGALEPNN